MANISSMTEVSIAVVVPARNEIGRLPELLARIPPTVENHPVRVIVIDDGSTDGTGDAARAAGATVLGHAVNLGKGAALATGCEAAMKLGAAIVVAMDADGQHDPGDLPRMVGPVLAGDTDLVLGYRRREGAMPGVLRLGNSSLNLTQRLLFGAAFRDSQCGYRAFRTEVYDKVRWRAKDYAVESEMLVRAVRAKLRVVEVPIATIYHDRYKGTQPLDGVRIVGRLVRLKLGFG